ncbi:MAG: hypothetical protein ABIR33_12035 [Pyrinomonadaceae bacterium]
METLQQINESTPAPRPEFLKRQFSAVPTLSQTKFDWYFGVGLPIVCIAADPIVFRNWAASDPSDVLLARYKIFCYVLSAVSILAMAAWLLWRNKLGELRPFLGGLFLLAAATSTLVGIVIAPLGAIGIIFYGLGLLGFVPLFSGFVFLRNSFRALESSAEDMSLKYVVRAAMLAVIYALVVPFVLNF